MTDADHFPVVMSSGCGYFPDGSEWPFFCCGRVGSCYKPAALITFMIVDESIQDHKRDRFH
jgi:hypothetical protein